MKWLLFLIIIGVLGCLVACGKKSAETTTPIDATTIDVNNLDKTINVQTAATLQSRDDVILVDVREQSEYVSEHIPNVLHIPMSEIESRVAELPTDKTLIITCRSGNRSGQVSDFLRSKGMTNIHNMAGGLLAWEKAGYPVEK